MMAENLLQNGQFDGAPIEYGGIPQLKVCPPWFPVWYERQDGDPSGTNFRPEYGWQQTKGRYLDPPFSQKVHTNKATHRGGIAQTVTGLTSGDRVRFAIQVRQESGQVSNPEATNHGRCKVGIDPNGGTLLDDPGIFWSEEERDHFEEWYTLSIEATVGAAGRVTVFTEAGWEWKFDWCDTDYDDAVLEVLEGSVEPPPEIGEHRIEVFLDGVKVVDDTFEAWASGVTFAPSGG